MQLYFYFNCKKFDFWVVGVCTCFQVLNPVSWKSWRDVVANHQESLAALQSLSLRLRTKRLELEL